MFELDPIEEAEPTRHGDGWRQPPSQRFGWARKLYKAQRNWDRWGLGAYKTKTQSTPNRGLPPAITMARRFGLLDGVEFKHYHLWEPSDAVRKYMASLGVKDADLQEYINTRERLLPSHPYVVALSKAIEDVVRNAAPDDPVRATWREYQQAYAEWLSQEGPIIDNMKYVNPQNPNAVSKYSQWKGYLESAKFFAAQAREREWALVDAWLADNPLDSRGLAAQNDDLKAMIGIAYELPDEAVETLVSDIAKHQRGDYVMSEWREFGMAETRTTVLQVARMILRRAEWPPRPHGMRTRLGGTS
jgi:hypothetical protein